MGTYLQLGTVARRYCGIRLELCVRQLMCDILGPGGDHPDPSAALLLVSGNVTRSEPASFIYIVLSTAWNCAVRRDP